MDFSNVLIIFKLSKYEWDQKRLNLSPSAVLEYYKASNIDSQVILRSHFAQGYALDTVIQAFPGSQVSTRDALKQGIGPHITYVISLGGDNSATYVSKFLSDQILVSINSDPKTSLGALTRFTSKDSAALAQKIATNSLTTERWSRLSITLNGQLCQFHPLSEVFIGEEKSIAMTRLRVEQSMHVEMQKHSGLIVATGAGSTGWFGAAAGQLAADILPMAPTDPRALFVARELFKGAFRFGVITRESPLLLTSYNDSHGIIALDSDPSEPEFILDFPAGAEAVIGVDPTYSLAVARQ